MILNELDRSITENFADYKDGIVGLAAFVMTEAVYIYTQTPPPESAPVSAANHYIYNLLEASGAAGLLGVGMSKAIRYIHSKSLAEDVYGAGGDQDDRNQGNQSLGAHQAFGKMGEG